jgi:aryl-alcohol dehydrogenase-like predicted oxidoreductase
MNSDFSRRNFLAAGLALPAANALPTAPAPALPALEPAPQGLAYRVLGKTGLKVTTVGYGCMITSDPTVITRAADMGINYFDSSRWYQKGNNERMVGAALGAKRKDIVLSTKVDAEDKEGALKELEMSLKELGTDHLDIWYLHGKDKPEAMKDELIEAQEIARQQGKVRFIGVSTHRIAGIADAVIKAGKMQVVLATYNFTMDAAATEAVAQLHKAGVGVVAMKVMAGGLRGRNPRPQMQRQGAPSAALKWVLKNQGVATTVPSMTDIEQLETNFKVMSQSFSDADQQILNARLEEIRPEYCRMCGRCDGKCPQGLPVSDVLRYLTYAEGYGQFPLGRERFMEMPERLTRVRCGDCTSCPIECPNGVRVTDRLIRAQELFA